VSKIGRPSSYTKEVAEKICDLIAAGGHMHIVCAEEWAPAERTVYQWLRAHDEFAQMYAHARERQQEVFAAQVVLIADTVKDAAIARNMMDARKWHASKVAPKKWGDRLEIDAKVETSHAPSDALMAFLAAASKAKNG
jgi:hypothetical protein